MRRNGINRKNWGKIGGEGDNMKIYEPRKDWRYALLSILGGLLFLAIYSYSNYNRIIGLLAIGFTYLHFYQWKTTVYRLQDDILHIRSGIFRQRIPIAAIQHVELVQNYNMFTSLAYRKLELNIQAEDKTKCYYLSPKPFNAFIEDITRQNPEITISEGVKEQCLLEIYEAENA